MPQAGPSARGSLAQRDLHPAVRILHTGPSDAEGQLPLPGYQGLSSRWVVISGLPVLPLAVTPSCNAFIAVALFILHIKIQTCTQAAAVSGWLRFSRR